MRYLCAIYTGATFSRLRKWASLRNFSIDTRDIKFILKNTVQKSTTGYKSAYVVD